MTNYTCPQCHGDDAPWGFDERETVPFCASCVHTNLKKYRAEYEARLLKWSVEAPLELSTTTRERL